MPKLLFSTGNPHKFAEAADIATELGVTLQHASGETVEIQSKDVSLIVDRKAKDAFARWGRPLFVEHTSLHLDFADGFPAGLTKHFLKDFGDDKICELFGVAGKNRASGVTTIGYCDGKTVRQFCGTMHGTIPPKADGIASPWGEFGWSRIFVPDGYTTTLSHIGMAEKNKFSMRRLAITAMVNALRGELT